MCQDTDCSNIQDRKQLRFPSARLHKIWSIVMTNYHAALIKNEVGLVMLMERSLWPILERKETLNSVLPFERSKKGLFTDLGACVWWHYFRTAADTQVIALLALDWEWWNNRGLRAGRLPFLHRPFFIMKSHYTTLYCVSIKKNGF